jgi:hypothetical protein
MPWHCAHAILYVRFKDGRQDFFPVWENVYLVEAESNEDACARAIEIAASVEGDSSGTFTWNDRPAEWVFVGIRKIVTVSHMAVGNNLASGDELTYSEFTVPDEASLRQLASGGPVPIEYTG